MARSVRRRAVRLGDKVPAKRRCISSIRWTAVVGLLLTLPAVGFAQSDEDATSIPRTPWGHPDLQGVWDYRTVTPLERPDALAGKAKLTEAEAASFEAEFARGVGGGDLRARPGTTEADVEIWFDFGDRLSDRRTSLIVDPSDGKIPPLTEVGRRRRAEAPIRFAGLADGPEDRPWSERCLDTRLPLRVGPESNYVQLFQTQDYVAILLEHVHDGRMVPLDARSSLSTHLRQFLGRSHGHWEDDTLVVETTHFDSRMSFQGSGPNMRLVERFTRVAANTLRYEYTINDSESFTRPWSAMMSLTISAAPLFEYACHEGNYSMPNVLRGARAGERAEAAFR